MKAWNEFKKKGDHVVDYCENKFYKPRCGFLGMLYSLFSNILGILKIILIIGSITLGVSFFTMLLAFLGILLK